VALSAHVRLIQDDHESVSLEEVYENYCENNGLEPDDILIYYKDALYAEISRLSIQLRKGNVEVLNLRVDVFQQICQNFIKSDLLTKYIQSFTSSPQEYWLFRQAFSRQYAGSIFLSYVMALGHRYPHKISFSKSEASVVTSEILPSMLFYLLKINIIYIGLNPNGQITLVEAVPFRLTPNLQEFMTPSVIEGVLSSAIHSIAEVYYKPESELCEFLPLIVRDELISWMLLSQGTRPRFVFDSDNKPVSFIHDMDILDQAGIDERQILGRVIQNCELIMKRCQTLACIKESEKVRIIVYYLSSVFVGN
jgi:transformation/transcription domain-associated protein